jgi:cAMP phosphodiesterase
MKIRVLGAFGGEGLGHRPSAFLINDRTLIDGGTVTGALSVPQQLSVEHAIVSHCHLDHIAGLVYLTETLGFCETGAAVTIASIDPVVSTLRSGVFNNILWPDFSKIPHADVPVVKYRTLVEEVEQRLGDLWVTPVQVNHTVPTTGFIIREDGVAVVYSGDTKATDDIWKAAGKLGRDLKAVFVETSFPNRLQALADLSGHLTPQTLGSEIAKIKGYDGPVYVYHVKSQYIMDIEREIDALNRRDVIVVRDRMEWEI